MASERGATRGRGRTRRAVLLTIMALGAVVSLTAVNGVFAIFTDRATTGENSASSRAEARSADLQIAAGTYDGFAGTTSCGAFVEDLTTAVITASDMVSGGGDTVGNVCLTNVGSRVLDLTTSVIDLVDTDHACTGDEGALDTTCGLDQAGDLSPGLYSYFIRSSCSDAGASLGSSILPNMVSTPFVLGTIGPDEVVCIRIGVTHQSLGDSITTRQSDTTTWKFAFDGATT